MNIGSGWSPISGPFSLSALNHVRRETSKCPELHPHGDVEKTEEKNTTKHGLMYVVSVHARQSNDDVHGSILQIFNVESFQ